MEKPSKKIEGSVYLDIRNPKSLFGHCFSVDQHCFVTERAISNNVRAKSTYFGQHLLCTVSSTSEFKSPQKSQALDLKLKSTDPTREGLKKFHYHSP